MLRRFIASLTLSLVLFSPVSAFARDLRSIVNTSAQTVERANFISWSFAALQLPKKESCTLPYARSPRGLTPTLCAAQEKGVLALFGKSKTYTLSKSITRGEALQVLTALTGLASDADSSKFTDIKTDAQRQAVANALAHKWMVPLRTTFFGLDRPLTGVEALSLLQAASGQVPVTQTTVKVVVPSGEPLPFPRAELINTVWELIQRDYLKSDDIKQDEVGYAAVEAVVKSLQDPYTTFFRPAGATAFQDQFKGELSGIGANVEDKDGVVTVVALIPGSPAEKAGLQPGDQILGADDKDFKGLSLDVAVSHIRGPKGTFVELKIHRGTTDMVMRIQRETISIPEVKVTWQGRIAIVQLMQFGETTEGKIRSVFTTIQGQSPSGIVLDLRNNPGGLLTAADIVVSNFVPKGSVVAHVKTKTETTEEVTTDEPTVDASVKVVVLVNKGSASASEIVAGALQDYKRATIVGMQTFGKGSVQEVINFKTGELLKMTIAHYFTPNNNAVDTIGITPDIVVDGDDQTQMDRALGLLR